MIVLDEHLPIPDLVDAIGRWYRGRVCTVNDLRPHTIVKDEAVPDLLRTVRQPTFVTLNWADFWRRIATYDGYCVICFTLSSKRAEEIAPMLRRLFRLEEFKTKAARMGKVARVSDQQVAYYQVHDAQLYLEPLP